MKNGDLVTREGLKTFADLCKERFYSEQIAFNSQGSNPCYLSLDFGSLDSNVTDIKIVITGAQSFLTVVSINIGDEKLSTIYNSGGVTVSKATYGESEDDFFVKLQIDANVSYMSVGCQAVAASKISYIKPTISLSSSMGSDLDYKITAKSASGSGSDVAFTIKTSETSDESYVKDKTFNTIWKAHQLDHNVKFELTTNNDLVQDGYNLSADNTVYIKTQAAGQLGNSFDGTDLDTVTVEKGLVTGGSASSAATNALLGKIKIGRAATATELPVQLDGESRAYVTLPTSIFTYKGQYVGDVNDIQNPRVGDVWTVKSDVNDTNGSEYIYVNKGTDKEPDYYWEYLGKKVEFDQIQANWNETDTSSKAYINNKPVKQHLFKRERLDTDKALTVNNVFDITDEATPTDPIECEILFYNNGELEVTVTPDASWKNMQSSDTEIKIPAGKYAEYVFTYWPNEGNLLPVVTYNGAVQP